MFNNPIQFLFIAGGFLIAITIHEYAHAWVSDRLGDPTAKLMGRLTLNPFKHLDLIGTLLILFAGIGWAKPVEIDPFNLRNPRRDAASIAFSGPLANLLGAGILSVLYFLLTRYAIPSAFLTILALFIEFAVRMNVTLAVFNLLPIHPLDGFSVVEGLLSEEKAKEWRTLKPYGILFILFLIFPFGNGVPPITRILSPITSFILSILIPSNPII